MSHGTGAFPSPPDERDWDIAELMAGEPIRSIPADFASDLGPLLDQDGIGACVAFAATGIRNWQEHADEGRWAFDTPSAYQTYQWLKHGHGSFGGDGMPGIEGSSARAVWDLARTEGIPARSGPPRRIAAYYRLSGVPGSEAWVATMQQVILVHGPVSVVMPWADNWFSSPTGDGILPHPTVARSSHMFARTGWRTIGGQRYWRHRNSWGAWGVTDSFGHRGEFLTPVEFDGLFGVRLDEAWKTIDITGDSPTPPPEVGMLPVYSINPALVDLPVGTQLYREDGKTPLVKVSAGGVGRFSPGLAFAGKLAVEISTGGIHQYAVANVADCRNIRPIAPLADCTAAIETATAPLAARLAAIKTAGGW